MVNPLPDNAFWGKFCEGTEGPYHYLPLSHHCLDVAAVLRALIGLPRFSVPLERAAERDLSSRDLDRMAVFGVLHDVGKANLGFQQKVFDRNAPRAGHIRELAPLFENKDLTEKFTSALQIDEIMPWFASEDGLERILLATWSHHGRPIRFTGERFSNYHLANTVWWNPTRQRNPMEATAELVRFARRAYPRAFDSGGPDFPIAPSFQHRFAGVLMLADWLGSHETFFPIVRNETNPVEFSKAAAYRAVRAIGLSSSSFRQSFDAAESNFLARFGFPPRHMQELVDDLDPADPNNRVVIVESETGSGKTEAALSWFYRLFASGKVDALYFALPTRVAAREIYERVVKCIRRAFPDRTVRPNTVLAVPGYTRINEAPLEETLPSESVQWNDDYAIEHAGRIWAAERPKRFLASPIAVGTIDQALLSTIQTRHAHLRSVCLDRSLLVVDEVHASDAYMNHLLRNLLSHHIGLGGHAMLLSATLGARARIALLDVTGSSRSVPSFELACGTVYPSVTNLTGAPIAVPPSKPRANRRISFELVPKLFELENMTDHVIIALQTGARVLVVLNTVQRVIRLQRLIEDTAGLVRGWLFACKGTPCPHHGRFAPMDRSILDRRVTERYGAESAEGPVLLIGTQTLEQSLDIDADMLITDLCPADVLLQRLGRLHRHDRPRPFGHENPRCVVLVPDGDSLEPYIDGKGRPTSAISRTGLGSVYADLRTVDLTWDLLRELPVVSLAKHARRFVETATHPERLATRDSQTWKKHAARVEGQTIAGEVSGHYAVANYNEDFGEAVFHDVGETVRTRLGMNAIQVELDREVPGPFHVPLKEVVIPGHMTAGLPGDFCAEIRQVFPDGAFTFSIGERGYSYSRFGLERHDEPPG